MNTRLFPLALVLAGSAAGTLGISAASALPQTSSHLLDSGSDPVSPQVLLAQRVVDGLPPPPALPPADIYNTPGGLPQPTILAPEPQPELRIRQPEPRERQRRDRPASDRPSENRQFVVVVDGDSPLLLNQVRQFTPDAFVGELEGNRVIQAGTFRSAAQAQQQARSLSSQGIQARVVSEEIAVAAASEQEIPVSPAARAEAANLPSETGLQYQPYDTPRAAASPREVTFGESPALDAPPPVRSPRRQEQQIAAVNRESPYYIVIPGRGGNVSAIREQVSRLGEGMAIARAVEERENRLGAHVLVGPFASRGAAERWKRYFRDFGMDARVYYRR